MTEINYKKLRKANLHNPLQVLYIYYEDIQGEHVEPVYFTQAFSAWAGKKIGEPLPNVIEFIVRYLDAKFNVTLLKDNKTNKILTII